MMLRAAAPALAWGQHGAMHVLQDQKACYQPEERCQTLQDLLSRQLGATCVSQNCCSVAAVAPWRQRSQLSPERGLVGLVAASAQPQLPRQAWLGSIEVQQQQVPAVLLLAADAHQQDPAGHAIRACVWPRMAGQTGLVACAAHQNAYNARVISIASFP